MAGVVAAVVLPLALAYAAEPAAQTDLRTYVTDGEVNAVVHAGGRTYIGGEFDHVGPRVGHGVSFQTGASASVEGDWAGQGTAGFPEVAGGEVHAVVSDGSGGWFIGGDFTSVGGVARSRLAHIDSGGQVSGWAASANDSVLALARDGDDLYVGGKFTQIGGQNRNHLAALGTSDASVRAWNPDPNSGGWVHALAVTTVTIDLTGGGTHDNPVLFAGGEFTKIPSSSGTNNAQRLAAIWGVGAVKKDNTLIEQTLAGTPPTVNLPVRAIQVGAQKPTGTGNVDVVMPVYVGGDFTSPPKNRLFATQFKIPAAKGPAALGTPVFSTYTNWSPEPNAPVRALALTQGSNPILYAGGDFTQIGSQSPKPTRNRIAALNAIPESFITNAGCTASPTVQCPGTASGWDPNSGGIVRAIAVSGNTVYAGGEFSEIGGPASPNAPTTSRHRLAALQASGVGDGTGDVTDWDPKLAGSTLSAGTTPTEVKGVNALAVNSDGSSVFAGGAFNSAGAVERHNLAALDSNGQLVAGWDPNVRTPCTVPATWKPATDPDCTLPYATGSCRPAAAGGTCDLLAKVLALTVANGVLYAGGNYTQIDGTERRHLAALDAASGELISGWNPGARTCPSGDAACTGEKQVSVMALDAAADAIYAGGEFTEVGGADRKGIAAIHPVGATDYLGNPIGGQVTGWNPQAIFSTGKMAQVHAIEAACTPLAEPGDVIYAGGNFDQIGGQPRARLAALNTTDGNATAWNPGPGSTVYALAASPDQQVLYAGGSFAVIGGAVRQKIAALSASDAKATNWNPSADQNVRALAVTGDGQTVLAGGLFNTIGEQSRSGLAALQANGVGDGSGDATAWDPAPNAKVLALDTSNDNAYAGGEFSEVGARAQAGVATFTAGADAADTGLHTCAPPPPPVPAVTIDSGPTGTVETSTAEFTFSFASQPGSGTTFECSLDGGAFEPCTSPKTYSGLANAEHTFGVRGVDTFGSRGPVTSRAWTFKPPPVPAVTIDSGPTGIVETSTAELTFSFASEPGPGTTFECSLDGAGFEPCTSPKAYTDLANAEHTFRVRGVDTFDSRGPESPWGWTVKVPQPGACANPVMGTHSRDVLVGTEWGEEFIARRGPDQVEGRGGDDCVRAGPENDVVLGEEGRDELHGQAGWDRLGGGPHKDELVGGDGWDGLKGGAGGDKLVGGDGRDRLAGGEGEDVLSGGLGKDKLAGGRGNDTIRSVDGNPDDVNCGPGHDRVRADRKLDKLEDCERVKRLGKKGRKKAGKRG